MKIARIFPGGARLAAIAALVLSAAAMPATLAYTDDENVSVSCYKGDGDNLGTIMVFSPEAAGQTCNSLYFGCKGKCYGCYSDFDLSQDVCYDNSGRRFLR